MRKLLLISTILLAFSPAYSQQIKLNVQTNDPVTGLDPETWASVAKKIIDARSIIGFEEVYMVNATNEELTVNCEKWQLVGPKPYIKTNPTSLRPFTVTLVKANDFNGYCKNGVVGATPGGDTYRGVLNAADGSFSDATFVTFMKQK